MKIEEDKTVPPPTRRCAARAMVERTGCTGGGPCMRSVELFGCCWLELCHLLEALDNGECVQAIPLCPFPRRQLEVYAGEENGTPGRGKPKETKKSSSIKGSPASQSSSQLVHPKNTLAIVLRFAVEPRQKGFSRAVETAARNNEALSGSFFFSFFFFRALNGRCYRTWGHEIAPSGLKRFPAIQEITGGRFDFLSEFLEFSVPDERTEQSWARNKV
jgi:hypothetical protein